MPFITSEARRMTDTIGPEEMGDYCFLHYREMLRAWRASPRWTTAHELYRKLLADRAKDHLCTVPLPSHDDNYTARELAWQVFFQLHVMPYELQKRTLNGEVDY
jgi:hypothetical protein